MQTQIELKWHVVQNGLFLEWRPLDERCCVSDDSMQIELEWHMMQNELMQEWRPLDD